MHFLKNVENFNSWAVFCFLIFSEWHPFNQQLDYLSFTLCTTSHISLKQKKKKITIFKKFKILNMLMTKTKLSLFPGDLKLYVGAHFYPVNLYRLKVQLSYYSIQER